ncbi:PAS domain-containing protein [Nisaea acidiphila]|uniref:PAS domain-containing protein n=1 Tax=Nisaea acidiphila TaxID=1862145 RepID=A0A9J7B064_9PROT|nr:PAS domain-containing protein [Nisaea acidiphila]UUX51876.1 PAS domain-containing protein [Nisaea acidiphila]
MTARVEAGLEKIFPEAAPPLLADFARYWLCKFHERGLPRWRDMDPVDFPWALSRIFILSRVESGRFAYHLVGEDLDRMLGGHLKGKTADQVFEPGYAEYTERRWERAAAERLVCYNGSFHLTVDNVPRIARRVLFPLSEDGELVDRLIGVVHFDRRGPDRKEQFGPSYSFLYWTEVSELI